jgi:hypothetical protein
MGAPWPIPEVSPGLTATSELQAARGKAQDGQQEPPPQQQQGGPREEQPQAQQQPEPAPEPAAAPPPPAEPSPAAAPADEAGEDGESEEQLYRLYDAVKVKPCSVAAVRKLYQQRDTPLRTRESIIDEELERVYRWGVWAGGAVGGGGGWCRWCSGVSCGLPAACTPRRVTQARHPALRRSPAPAALPPAGPRRWSRWRLRWRWP